MKKTYFPLIFWGLGALVCIGMIIFLTALLTPQAYRVHHHANMVVYIDGNQWDFGRPIYMEEVERCNITEWVLPSDRIHLHENKGDLIHVHMAASTWGDLFSNLYWNFGSGYLVDDFGKMYLANEEKNLYFFINGERINNPHNRVVESEDRLLIWYGSGSEAEVRERFFPQVPGTAREYNQKEDPASCSANETTGVIHFFTNLFQ